MPYNGTENRLECDMLCYQVAFAQIISSYSLFFVFVVCVLTYRIYLITCYDSGSGRFRVRRKKWSVS